MGRKPSVNAWPQSQSLYQLILLSFTFGVKFILLLTVFIMPSIVDCESLNFLRLLKSLRFKLWVTLFVNFRWNKFYNALCYIRYGKTWLDKRIRIWVYLLDYGSCYHYRNHSSLHLLLMKNTDIEVSGIIASGIGIGIKNQ